MSRKTEIAIGVVLGIVLIVGFFYSERCHAPDVRIAKTRAQLGCLKLALNAYYSEYHIFPRGNEREVANVLTNWKDLSQNSKGIHFLERSALVFDSDGYPIDEWGKRFVFTASPDHRSIWLTSFGPNESNDGGKMDDLVEGVSANELTDK